MAKELDSFILKQEALEEAERLLEGKSTEFKDGFYLGCQFTADYHKEMQRVYEKEVSDNIYG